MKERLEALQIPIVYNVFPQDFQLDVNGWSFPDDKDKPTIDVELSLEEIAELESKGFLGKINQVSDRSYQIKRLRTLDIEIAPDEVIDEMNALAEEKDASSLDLQLKFGRLYRKTCTQRCPHCFNQEDDFYVSKIISDQKLMRWAETNEVIQKAKKLGLESVKFLGIGEFFKNPRLFHILDELQGEGIKAGIFTKGSALGDDLIARNCGYDGINNAEDLVKRLAGYDNVSVLLGANSFNPQLQDEMVGCGQDSQCVKDYTIARNKALQLLVKYRFNDPSKGKRLALIAAPVTPQASDETVEMYEWGMRRNIPVITIPTMVSGKGKNELEWLLNQFETDSNLVDRFDPKREMTREKRYTEWLTDFYTDVYSKAIDMGITTIEKINLDGISGYAGTAQCQQKQNGMYLRLPGTVQECPGRCVGAEITGDIRKTGLLSTWIGSRNYDRKKDCNSLCAVKMKDLTGSGEKPCDCCEVYENVGSMPPELGSRVIEKLNQKYGTK